MQTTSLILFFSGIAGFVRSYSLVGNPQHIDSWVGLGYGSAFPKTSFAWHYYKESRILHSFFTNILLNFEGSFWGYSISFLLIIGLASTLFYKAFRVLQVNVGLSIFLSTIFCLSPLLWGDKSGGFDHYNTFGNLYFSLAIYIFSLLYTPTIYNYSYLLMGFVSCLLIMEIPGGVMYVAWIELALLSTSFRLLFMEFKKPLSYQKFAFTLFLQALGVLLFLLIELIFLGLVGENSARLWTGPKFLFDILNQRAIYAIALSPIDG